MYGYKQLLLAVWNTLKHDLLATLRYMLIILVASDSNAFGRKYALLLCGTATT